MKNKQLLNLYLINFKLGLKFKPSIIFGFITISLLTLFFVIISFADPNLYSSSNGVGILELAGMLKISFYSSMTIFLTIFIALNSMFYFKNQERNGIIKIEQRAGISGWTSYLIRTACVFSIILVYLICATFITLLLFVTSGVDKKILDFLLWRSLGFLYFFSIIIFAIVSLICVFLSSSIGLLVNSLMGLMVALSPILNGVILTQSDFKNSLKLQDLNQINLQLNAGQYFYDSLKNDGSYNGLFKDKNFRKIFWDENSKNDVDHLNPYEKNGFISQYFRIQYLGQGYFEDLKDEYIYKDTFIGKIYENIYLATKKFDNSQENLTNNWFFSLGKANHEKISLGNMDSYWKYLKENEYTMQYSKLLDVIYYYLITNKSNLSNIGGNIDGLDGTSFEPNQKYFPLIKSESNDLIFKFKFKKGNEDYQLKDMEVYERNPEIMIFMWTLSNLYRASIYFNKETLLSLEDKSDEEEVEKPKDIKKYYEIADHYNLLAKANFTSNFTYIFYGNEKSTFLNESIVYYSLTNLIMTDYRGTKYYSRDIIEEILEKSNKNSLEEENTSLFTNSKKIKGFNIAASVTCWIILAIVISGVSGVIFVKKQKD